MSATKNQKNPKGPSREKLLQAIGLMTTAKPTMLMRPNDPIGMAKEIVEEMDFLREECARLTISNTLSGSFDTPNAEQHPLKNLRGEELVWCECGSEMTPYCRYIDHGVIKGHICLKCNKCEDIEYDPTDALKNALDIGQLAENVIKRHKGSLKDREVVEGPSEVFECVREQRDQLQEQLVHAEEEIKFLKMQYANAVQYMLRSVTDFRMSIRKVQG